MNFKLNTTKKSAEVAGQYTGQVIYNASVGDKNGGTTSGTVESFSAGDTLDIEGTKYVVLEQKENNQALIMTASSIGSRAFQSNYNRETELRSDGQNANTYEGSAIDNYLENEWYEWLLPTKIKKAIQTTNIKQASYAYNDLDSKQETGYNGQTCNTISRHTFLPSVSEIGKAVDLKNSDKVKAFLNDTSIWTRDSDQDGAAGVVYLNVGYAILLINSANSTRNVRPAFVIDLSQVNYSVVK